MEASRRETKRRKLEAVHPEQILVRQARERLNRLIGSTSKSFIRRFVITEKAPTRAFSWLKAASGYYRFHI